MSDDNVVNFGLKRLFSKPAPWETMAEHKANLHSARKAANEMILDRIRGIPANQGTEETENDPCNPNIKRP